MKFIFFSILTLSISLVTNAQTESDKEGVKRALLDYIEGFYEGDTLKLSRSISKDVVKYGYWKDKNATTYTGEAMPYSEVISYALKVKSANRPVAATAPRITNVYEIQDQTASGKVTAWWGTDYILLEKVGGKWMIRMVLWQGPLKS